MYESNKRVTSIIIYHFPESATKQRHSAAILDFHGTLIVNLLGTCVKFTKTISFFRQTHLMPLRACPVQWLMLKRANALICLQPTSAYCRQLKAVIQWYRNINPTHLSGAKVLGKKPHITRNRLFAGSLYAVGGLFVERK